MTQPKENILLAGMQASAAADGGVYLGSLEAVDVIVREFISDAADAIDAKDGEALLARVERAALVFAGQEPGFVPIPDWAVRDKLGIYAAERWEIDPNQPLVEILRAMFLMLASEIIEMVKQGSDLDEEDMQFRVDVLAERARATLTGTYEVTFPEGE